MKLTKQDGPLFGLILAMACMIGALFSCIVLVGMPTGVDGTMPPSAKREILVSVEKHHRHRHRHHHD
jgi:hypothetical protein